MECEDGVVGLSAIKVHARTNEFEPHGEPERYAHKEEGERRDEVKEADPLMVGREDPSEDAREPARSIIEARFHTVWTP